MEQYYVFFNAKSNLRVTSIRDMIATESGTDYSGLEVFCLIKMPLSRPGIQTLHMGCSNG
jgi:hypothetical protein